MSHPSRALVIGGGSIGQRHCEVLRHMGVSTALVSRHLAMGGAETGVYFSLAAAWAAERFDYVVVAVPTAAHGEVLRTLREELGYRGLCLCEKPLVAASCAAVWLTHPGTRVGYVLRFHPVVRRARELLRGKRIRTLNFHVGQYLPDWRPGRDYRQCYSARRADGGGVLRDLSHELDLLLHLGGPWQAVTALIGDRGELEIDSEASAELLVQMASGASGQCHLDYLARRVRRDFQIEYDGGSLRGDLIAGVLWHNDREEHFTWKRNDLFVAMHRELLDGTGPLTGCTASEAMMVVGLIDSAETAARERRWCLRAELEEKECI